MSRRTSTHASRSTRKAQKPVLVGSSSRKRSNVGLPVAISAAPSPHVPDPQPLDCAAFELMLAEVLDRDQLPLSARRHLQTCAACANVLATFEDIAARVRLLPPDEAEPSVNLWPHIAARLRAEGIIHADLESCRASVPAPRLVSRGSKSHARQ
ncbi:MAG: hypothetical protein ACRD4Q_06025 [Candidatus Acidiferrales bacterium]